MTLKSLTGIERELVLQYLIDGNVPVTVIPVEEQIKNFDSENLPPVTTAVFPVAIKGEKLSVSKKGSIILKNVPDSIKKLTGQSVKIEFYFNHVGLFFVTKLKSVKQGLALEIPDEINRIEIIEETKKYNFYAVLYYSMNANRDLNFNCVPAEGIKLFTKPVWSCIPLESQKEAKKYLEKFVDTAKNSGKSGNGIQLINICKYIVENDEEKNCPGNGQVKPFQILFVDHERIVLGFEENEALKLEKDKEYALKMSFSLSENCSVKRDIFVTFTVNTLYSNEKSTKFCADCSYTTIQNEDSRFLYEKATSSLYL